MYPNKYKIATRDGTTLSFDDNLNRSSSLCARFNFPTIYE